MKSALGAEVVEQQLLIDAGGSSDPVYSSAREAVTRNSKAAANRMRSRRWAESAAVIQSSTVWLSGDLISQSSRSQAIAKAHSASAVGSSRGSPY